MPESDAILIAGQSGRALAQAARRAGLRPFVLDLFGDEDTLALAEAHRTLPGRFGTGRLGGEAVLSGLDALAAFAGGKPLGVVLGSGFEAVPQLMTEIAARYSLFGADATTVSMLKEPFAFGALCERLAIPHPAITADPVAPRRAWLLKRVGGSGGSHIRAATTGAAPPGHYFQARMPGSAYALNVLTDGHDLEVLSLTEQWSAPNAIRPYRFAGAIARGQNEASAVDTSMLDAITDSVRRLVAATGLRGLASADLLIDGDAWWLLEINPRPGATLDALDRRETSLLLAHIEASLGRMPELGPPPGDAAGSEICYAARRYACMSPLSWPEFARDRPRPGSVVGCDAPLCTVTATGPDAATVREMLRERTRTIAALLDQREDENGYRHQAAEHQRADGPAGRAPRR